VTNAIEMVVSLCSWHR